MRTRAWECGLLSKTNAFLQPLRLMDMMHSCRLSSLFCTEVLFSVIYWTGQQEAQSNLTTAMLFYDPKYMPERNE